jgi:hypothetical protein
VLSRPLVRRPVLLEGGAEILSHLPGPGEALHAVTTGRRTDVTAVVSALLHHHGPATLHVATLSMSRRNLKDMLAWADAGSRITLLVSSFFWRHNKAFWANELLPAFAARPGCSAGHWRNHCKVVAMDFGALKYSLEGSANLRGCDSWEQFSLIRDDGLHGFHAGWISERVGACRGREED